jgi:Bacterial EndoU nuclease
VACIKPVLVRYIGRIAIIGATAQKFPTGPALEVARQGTLKATLLTRAATAPVGSATADARKEQKLANQGIRRFLEGFAIEHLTKWEEITDPSGSVRFIGYHYEPGPWPADVHVQEAAVDIATGNARYKMTIETEAGTAHKLVQTMFNPAMSKVEMLREIRSAHANLIESRQQANGNVWWRGKSSSGAVLEGFREPGGKVVGYPSSKYLPRLSS